MKRLVMVMASIALFVSCTKEFDSHGEADESVPEAVAEDGICADGCPACDLVHHQAKDPTYYESGNNEYWQCPHCKAFYADPNAETRYEGQIYILPTRIIRGEENLRWLAGDLSADTKTPLSKLVADKASEVALIATIAGIVVGVIAIGVTIGDLCETNDDIEKAVTDLSGKIDKTQEEIAVLADKICQLQSSVAQTAELMSTLSTQVDSLYYYMDSLVERSRSLERTADKIFDGIEYMDDDFHYRKILDDRHHDLSAITDPCTGAIYGIKERVAEDISYFASAKDYEDSLAVIRMCMMDINDVVGAWGSDKGNYVTTSCNLVRNYSHMSNQTWENFPSVLEAYINRHLIWTHQGYPYRIRSLMYDMVVTGCSYMLARMYFTGCTGWERNYADQKIKALDSDFNSMLELYKGGMDKMFQEDTLYRHCLVNGKTFSVRLSEATDVLKDYVTCLESRYGSAAVYDSLASCQQLFFQGDSTSSLTWEDWEYMQAASYASEKSYWNVLPSYNDGGMGFIIDNEKSHDTYFTLTYPYTQRGELFVAESEPGVRSISLCSGNAWNTYTIDVEEMGTMTRDGSSTTVNYNSIYYMIGMLFPYTGDLL